MVVFGSPELNRLERFAALHVGVPWVDECWDLTKGADCWTWCWHCYYAAGIVLPRNVWGAKPLFVAVEPPGIPGDILHFWPPNAPREHLGIRLRQLKFTDCNWGGAGVAINNLTQAPWLSCLKGAWRYVGEPPECN